MIDEIELLRRFRNETPPPSGDAWARARAVVADAASDETVELDSSSPIRSHRRRPGLGRRIGVGGRRATLSAHAVSRKALSAAAVALVLLAGALVAQLPFSHRLSGPVHTQWSAVRALPTSRTHFQAPTGTWQLADYITSEGWQQNTTGPEPGNLTCPTALVCFVTGDNARSSSGPAKFNSLYVSYDGALSWNVLPVPAGVDFTTRLACATVDFCAAGGTDAGQPVYLSTSDGGHSFTIAPLPAGDGQLYSLSCPSTTFCAGLAATSADSNSTPIDARLLTTTNDGLSFVDASIVAGQSMDSLVCPTSANCVAVGTSDVLGANDWTAGVVANTTNAGQSWTSGALPAGFGISYLSRMSCTDAQHCFVLGNIAIANPSLSQCSNFGAPSSSSGPTTTTTTPPSSAVEQIAQQQSAIALKAYTKSVAEGFGYTCSSGTTMWVSDVASTSDGGLTWTPDALPASAPQPMLSDIACSSATSCVVTGSAANPQRFGPEKLNEGSAIVLVTVNGGVTWSAVSFAVPSKVPGGVQLDAYMAIGDVQCPQTNQCIALGVSNQGSKTTPVYKGGDAMTQPLPA